MPKKHRKQWDRGNPIQIANTKRVSYPIGDSRRRQLDETISESSQLMEWTIRPNGINFCINRNKEKISENEKKSKQTTQRRRKSWNKSTYDTKLMPHTQLLDSDLDTMNPLWVPCYHILESGNNIWTSQRINSNEQDNTIVPAFFHASSRKTVLSQSLVDRGLVPFPFTYPNNSKNISPTVDRWLICYARRPTTAHNQSDRRNHSVPDDVYWWPEEIPVFDTNPASAVPYFCRVEGENLGPATWSVPDPSPGVLTVVEDASGHIISMYLIATTQGSSVNKKEKVPLQTQKDLRTGSFPESECKPVRENIVMKYSQDECVDESSEDLVSQFTGAISTLRLSYPDKLLSRVSQKGGKNNTNIVSKPRKGRHSYPESSTRPRTSEGRIPTTLAASDRTMPTVFNGLQYLHSISDIETLRSTLVDILEKPVPAVSQAEWGEIFSQQSHRLLRELIHVCSHRSDADSGNTAVADVKHVEAACDTLVLCCHLEPTAIVGMISFNKVLDDDTCICCGRCRLTESSADIFNDTSLSVCPIHSLASGLNFQLSGLNNDNHSVESCVVELIAPMRVFCIVAMLCIRHNEVSSSSDSSVEGSFCRHCSVEAHDSTSTFDRCTVLSNTLSMALSFMESLKSLVPLDMSSGMRTVMAALYGVIASLLSLQSLQMKRISDCVRGDENMQLSLDGLRSLHTGILPAIQSTKGVVFLPRASDWNVDGYCALVSLYAHMQALRIENAGPECRFYEDVSWPTINALVEFLLLAHNKMDTSYDEICLFLYSHTHPIAPQELLMRTLISITTYLQRVLVGTLWLGVEENNRLYRDDILQMLEECVEGVESVAVLCSQGTDNESMQSKSPGGPLYKEYVDGLICLLSVCYECDTANTQYISRGKPTASKTAASRKSSRKSSERREAVSGSKVQTRI
mmetsp:Transcript_14366/g.21533  ORF Transcript_14366/g.21533 Transcript_14366/m.21533 type:complete len:915 (-) Transcript_14366:154-2898(-)